jgi:prephenate dehydrogenase
VVRWALDIKGLYPEATVYGDTDEDHLQEALALGVVLELQINKLSDADFVILSVPFALTLLPKF